MPLLYLRKQRPLSQFVKYPLSIKHLNHRSPRLFLLLTYPNHRAILSPYHSDAGGYYNGHVRLFEYNTASSSDASWDQVLHDIAGETSREEAGRGVAMSKDGMRIVVSSPLYGREGNGYYRGAVRVYEETVSAAPSLPYIAPIYEDTVSAAPSLSYIAPILPTPIVPTLKFQIKSSYEYDSLCLSATFMGKIVVKSCITSIDSPLRTHQIWTMDDFGQLKLAGMGDDICAASISRKLVTTTCPTTPDATMQFLIPDVEGPIKQKKNGKDFVVGFDLFNELSTMPVHLFEEEGSNLPSNVFSSPHFNTWSIQAIVE